MELSGEGVRKRFFRRRQRAQKQAALGSGHNPECRSSRSVWTKLSDTHLTSAWSCAEPRATRCCLWVPFNLGPSVTPRRSMRYTTEAMGRHWMSLRATQRYFKVTPSPNSRTSSCNASCSPFALRLRGFPTCLIIELLQSASPPPQASTLTAPTPHA